MELQHVNVKLFAENPEQVEQDRFTPIFHRWIQEQNGEELLIDVADYLHVDAGPGIVLIGDEADYSMDNSNHRLGLRYNRKAPLPGDNQERFRHALKSVLGACLRLEGDASLAGKLKFNRKEIEFFINDRALAPNTNAIFVSCKGELEKFFREIFNGNNFTMEHNPDPRVRFGVLVKTTKPFDLDALLKKL
jgi:hypothetical protein